MREVDRLFLSKFAIDPNMDSEFDSYDLPDFDLGPDIDPDLDHIEIDMMDEDTWDDN